MSEKRRIKVKKISYKGVFKVKEVLDTIRDWMKEYSYTPIEAEIKEVAHETGKDIQYKFAPYKKINDYVKYVLKIKATFEECKDMNVKKESGRSTKVQEGSVTVKIEQWLETDYKRRWEGNPVKIFFRTLLDKFMMKNPIDQWTAQMDKESNRLEKLLNSYFNLQVVSK